MTWETSVPDFPFDDSRVWKIVASAGCGKSYQISKAIKDLVFTRGVHPSKIMYIVYNKRPAQEFKADLAIQGIDESTEWIGTHHSVCRTLMNLNHDKILAGASLKEWGTPRGFAFGEDEDQRTEWDNILSSLDKKIYEGSSDLDPYEKMLLSALKTTEVEEGKYTHTRYLASCLAKELFPKDVEYVFVDEAQDNARIQFDYFKSVLTRPQVKGFMLVGDDKQAINAYKGGRHDLFLDFKADRYVCLPTTHRNTKSILTFANAIAEPILSRSPLTTETVQPEPGEVLYASSLEDCTQTITESIKEKKSVLVLTRNRIYRNIATQVLTENGVFILSKKMARVMALFNQMRLMAGRVLTYKDVASLFSHEPEDGEIKKTAYARRGVVSRFLRADYSLDKDPELYAEYFLAQSGIELETFGISERLADDIRATATGKVPLGVFAGVSDAEALFIESYIRDFGFDAPSVVVSVIHPIKGSEADVVVLLKNITYAVKNTESTDVDSERRVWYVAATRAKSKLLVTSLEMGLRQQFTSII